MNVFMQLILFILSRTSAGSLSFIIAGTTTAFLWDRWVGKHQTKCWKIFYPHCNICLTNLHNLCGRTVQSRRLDCSVFAVRLFNSKRSGCSTWAEYSGTPIFPDSITKWISKFSDKYGIEHFTPHNLRHTNVSLLFANGVDVRTVADLVGHAQTSTTLNIYAHVMASTKQAAALKLGEAITTLTQEAVSKKQQDDGRISI